MAVIIKDVLKGSLAEKAGIKPLDMLISINGNDIEDILDYQFYLTEKKLILVITNQDGKPSRVKIKKQQYDDIGLLFETYLMDKKHTCKNKCIFCFVDQMPPDMRETLYFKDDDSRLSFLFGNYTTLTNMPERDVQRIIKMHISPINVSVHTTNPKLRVAMMRNPNAGTSLEILKRFAEAGIKLNTQLVLCPGINDGDELRRSLADLSALYPSVQSIAVVPVGITSYREKLDEIEPYNKDTAKAVIDIVDEFSNNFLQKNGVRLAYSADEFYIKAEQPIPEYDYYEEFNQLENGVGLMALLKDEFETALDDIEKSSKTRHISIATGVDAEPFISKLVDDLCKKWHNLTCNVYAIKNNFFGETITVAGLVTATDLIGQLKGKFLGEELLIPSVMLRHEKDKFLDDKTVADVETALNIKVKTVDNDGYELLSAIIGE